MENARPKTPYSKVQEQLVDAIVSKVQGGSDEFTPQEIIQDNEIDTSEVHPETVRALCHYSSVLAGEKLNVGIKFTQEVVEKSEWVGNGFNGRQETKVVLISKFIVNRAVSEDQTPSGTPETTAEKRSKLQKSRHTRKHIKGLTQKRKNW